MRSILLATLVLAGCGSTDPCAGKSGTCIGLHVVGTIATLDQLAFTIKPGSTSIERTPVPSRKFQLPVKVALFPPAGTSGTVHVSADAFLAGALVGHGSADAPLVNGRGQATLTLVAGATNDMSGAAHDLAGADLSGRDLAGADLAACATTTACTGGDGCCPGGCNANNDNDCSPVCGNGVVEAGERCDDGNTVNGDGCDPTCLWLGQMATLSGVPGGCGYADGPAARFLGFSNGAFSGIATDGNFNYFVSDLGTLTIRQFTLTTPPTTLIGSAFDSQALDGNFATARIHGGDSFGIPLTFLLGNSKLYFADYNGNARVLREVDLANKTVTTIPATVVKNNPIALTPDDLSNFTIYYIGSAGDVNKWTVGDAASTQIVTGAAINTAMGGMQQTCTAITRSGSTSYLGCNWGIIQVTDAGAISTAAIGKENVPGCSDNANASMATFSNIYSLVGVPNNWVLTSCNSVRQAQSGVTTVAGQIAKSGYQDGPATSALFGSGSLPLLVNNSLNGGIIGDSANCALRNWSNGMVSTIAGSPPVTADVRGSASMSRYTGAVAAGLVTDGTNAYLLGVRAGGGASELISIDLANGTSTDLLAFSTNPNAITRIGSTLYVSMQDGTIHSITTAGTNDSVLVGTQGTTSPPSDGTPGMLRTAVLNPKAITTDGTDLYFFDQSKLVRKVSLSTATVSTIAGTAGTTDVVDGVGTNAHFGNTFDDIVYARGNLYVSDGVFGNYQHVFPNAIREINLATGQVTTIAGQVNNFGDSDGVGLQAMIAAAPYLGTDGRSIFISDAGPPPVLYSSVHAQPTIRQLDLDTLSVTTMLGQRGQTSILNGTGTKTLVHWPGKFAFDATKHALYFFDTAEGVVQVVH